MRTIMHYIFYILLSALMVNTYFIYYYSPLTLSFTGFFENSTKALASFILTEIVLFLIGLFIAVETDSTKAIVKKNAIRTSLVLSFLLVISTIIEKYLNGFSQNYSNWVLIQSISFFIIFLLILILSKILFNRLVKINNNNINKNNLLDY